MRLCRLRCSRLLVVGWPIHLINSMMLRVRLLPLRRLRTPLGCCMRRKLGGLRPATLGTTPQSLHPRHRARRRCHGIGLPLLLARRKRRLALTRLTASTRPALRHRTRRLIRGQHLMVCLRRSLPQIQPGNTVLLTRLGHGTMRRSLCQRRTLACLAVLRSLGLSSVPASLPMLRRVWLKGLAMRSVWHRTRSAT